MSHVPELLRAYSFRPFPLLVSVFTCTFTIGIHYSQHSVEIFYGSHVIAFTLIQ